MSRTILAARARNTGPATLALDDTGLGSFTRALAAFGQTAAPTDGSTPFLTLFGSGDMRIVDYGDGNGPALLIEEQRTNEVWYSRDVTNAVWQNTGGTETLYAAPGPDGNTPTSRWASSGAGQGEYQGPLAPGASAFYVMSAWVRAVTGTAQTAVSTSNGSTAAYTADTAITTTYQRLSVEHATNGANVAYPLPWEGRGAPNGPAAQNIDNLADLAQLELGTFPTSAIPTTGGPVTRPPDIRTFTSAEWPSEFLTNGFVVEICPEFSSAESIADAGVRNIVARSAGGSDGVLCIYESGGVLYVLLQGASGYIQRALTFSRDQKLTITAKPTAGELTVAGATTGNGTTTGTVGAWTAGTMHVGSGGGSSAVFSGRFLGGTGGLITEAA